MQFYEITVPIKNSVEEKEAKGMPRSRKQSNRGIGAIISKNYNKYNETLSDEGFFFPSDIADGMGVFGIIVCAELDVHAFVEGYVEQTNLTVDIIEMREIVLYQLSELLREGERNGFLADADEVLQRFQLEALVDDIRGRQDIFEKLIQESNQKAIYQYANECNTRGTLLPELDRIFDGRTEKKVYGHPVDYIIESDDEDTVCGVIKLLTESLYNVGRISNRRYCEIALEPDSRISNRSIRYLYKSCVGGTVVTSFSYDKSDDDEYSYGDYNYLEGLCRIITAHRCDVLTIMVIPSGCNNLRTRLFENLRNCSFVEIRDDILKDDGAKKYLKARAKSYGMRSDKALLRNVEADRGYLVPELKEIFDDWYSMKLKTTVYSQYSDIASAKTLIKDKKPIGNAYEELESMIGLESAKEVVYQAIDSCKAQKIFKDKGLATNSMTQHMIFTGNPGTAKTTVARLFARILRDNKVLTRGDIVEVGRGDLVGKYVGWTAPIIKRKFSSAQGGILFIDEAYSLVDDRSGSFGDEAINTIVQEMENHRDDVIVIFAGYPDKMEQFLEKNPGLRSRIAHYVHFEDYTTEELCQIANHIAGANGLVIEDEAMDKIKGIMDSARARADFGNGRYVRNVIEKAQMAHNSRLVRMDYDSVTTDEVKTLTAEDIVAPKVASGKGNIIGFAV